MEGLSKVGVLRQLRHVLLCLAMPELHRPLPPDQHPTACPSTQPSTLSTQPQQLAAKRAHRPAHRAACARTCVGLQLLERVASGPEQAPDEVEAWVPLGRDHHLQIGADVKRDDPMESALVYHMCMTEFLGSVSFRLRSAGRTRRRILPTQRWNVFFHVSATRTQRGWRRFHLERSLGRPVGQILMGDDRGLQLFIHSTTATKLVCQNRAPHKNKNSSSSSSSSSSTTSTPGPAISIMLSVEPCSEISNKQQRSSESE
eukprot:2124616-Rhodomonas_salina.1